MSTVSDKTRTFVKPKSQGDIEFPAHRSPHLNKSPVALCEDGQSSRIESGKDPETPDRSELELAIGVLAAEHRGRRTSLRTRYIVGIIAGRLHGHYSGRVSEETIARDARCYRSRVVRAIEEAEAAGLLEVDDSDRCHRYHIPERVKHLPKIWVNPGMVRDDGYSIVQACWVSYVKFRVGDNEETWFTHREAAEVLGVSYHTAYRTAGWGAAQCLVQKRHRPERHSSRNEYALTGLGEEATGVFGPKSARPKWGALGQTSVEGGCSYARFTRNGGEIPEFGLSFGSIRGSRTYRALRIAGIHDLVAVPLATQWRDEPESVKQAVVNGIVRRGDIARRLRRAGLAVLRFNLAGYAVASLNQAWAEGHGVKPSKLVRAAQAGGGDQVAAVTHSCHTESVFNQRRQEQIRQLFTPPAKPPTPCKSAIPVSNRRLCDKKAEDIYLQRCQAEGRRRYFGRRKSAKSAQKADFSLDRADQVGFSL